MRVHILKWAKFNNPRKDVKSTSWFRFQNKFFFDPDFCDLPLDQKWVFPFLCSLASENMSEEFEVSPTLASKILNIEIEAFHAAIKHLQERGIIEIPTVRKRLARVTDPLQTRDVPGANPSRNGTERNGTEHNSSSSGKVEEAAAELLPKDCSTPIRDLAELWNANKSAKQTKINLKLLKPTQPRWKAAKARLSEFPDLDYWAQVIKKIAANGWCNGENDRRWVADFDYLVRPETHVKVHEGRQPFQAKAGCRPELQPITMERTR